MHLPPITIGGQILSLAHLSPIHRWVCIELQGGITKKVEVEFSFSCHCYSRATKSREIAPKGWAVPDGSTHLPRHRVFDAERYALSKDIIGLLDHLISTNGKVSKTQHDNFYRYEAVVVERDGRLKPVSYFIFMRSKRVQTPGQKPHVRVNVESAYAVSDERPPPAGGWCRSFGRMLGESWSSPTIG